MSSTKTTSLTSADMLSLLANRRSYYALTSNSTIPDSQIQTMLQQTLLTVPSAFNSQSTRIVLALGTHHHAVWDTTTSILRKQMGEERWSSAPTGSKLQGFRAAHGTVLFYEDTADVESKKTQFASYAQHFDAWSEQTSGMHQLAVWAALEAEGMGANLQHYNPVIDEEVAKMFDVPASWRLRAQMVFGAVKEGEKRPDPKEKKSTDVTLKVFGAE